MIDEALKFWARVEITDRDDCWEWTGAHGYGEDSGYAYVSWHGRSVGAHRIAVLLTGRVPSNGEVVDHLCRNRGCVNPRHLEVVTPRLNTLRGEGPTAVNARKTHCGKGHALAGYNLISRPGGWRGCRRCKVLSDRSFRARNGATTREDKT